MQDHLTRVLPRRAREVVVAALALALLLAVTGQAATSTSTPAGSATEAARLDAELARSAELAGRRLAPEATTLRRVLPDLGKRVDSLRGPAATTEEQLGVALSRLQQMTGLRYDPNYMPALIAIGRAYVAATGSDPLTATPVDPEYAGLSSELAVVRARLRRRAAGAAELAKRTKRLAADLRRQKRRAARLAAALGRRAGPQSRG